MITLHINLTLTQELQRIGRSLRGKLTVKMVWRKGQGKRCQNKYTKLLNGHGGGELKLVENFTTGKEVCDKQTQSPPSLHQIETERLSGLFVQCLRLFFYT
jgi:hypothetical protein